MPKPEIVGIDLHGSLAKPWLFGSHKVDKPVTDSQVELLMGTAATLEALYQEHLTISQFSKPPKYGRPRPRNPLEYVIRFLEDQGDYFQALGRYYIVPEEERALRALSGKIDCSLVTSIIAPYEDFIRRKLGSLTNCFNQDTSAILRRTRDLNPAFTKLLSYGVLVNGLDQPAEVRQPRNQVIIFDDDPNVVQLVTMMWEEKVHGYMPIKGEDWHNYPKLAIPGPLEHKPRDNWELGGLANIYSEHVLGVKLNRWL